MSRLVLNLISVLYLCRADDEDPVDLKPEIEEDCKPKCAKPLFKYNVSLVVAV